MYVCMYLCIYIYICMHVQYMYVRIVRVYIACNVFMYVFFIDVGLCVFECI